MQSQEGRLGVSTQEAVRVGTLETQVGGLSREDFLEEEACRGKQETRPAQGEGRTSMAADSTRREACSRSGLGS